jgi:YHYH protein
MNSNLSRLDKLTVLFVATLTSACGGGGSDATTSTVTAPAPSVATTTPTSTISTAGIGCARTDSGTQALVYTNTSPTSPSSIAVSESLPYNYTWGCATTRSVTGNGVPNHAVTGGNFATKISVQAISKTFTLTPTLASAATAVQIPGTAINSIKFEPGTAGTCPSTASATSACNYAGGGGIWRMEALPGNVSPWKFDFGTDINKAHVQPNGEYHYHGVPEGLVSKLNSASATSMTLVGWASDGFPMYARYGYTTALNSSSALKVLTGSYRVKTTADAGRPSTASFPMGHFVQDWEYVAGLGDLDQCNGRTGVTPEFPNGIYHYVITDSYPYIQRCVNGTVP